MTTSTTSAGRRFAMGAIASAAMPMFSMIRDNALELRADVAEGDVIGVNRHWALGPLMWGLWTTLWLSVVSGAAAAGAAPWDVPADPGYLISKGRSESPQHAYTDSSSSASSMRVPRRSFKGSPSSTNSSGITSTLSRRTANR